MVRNHVPERSRHIKITAALLHANGFCHRDLNMVNIAAVPDGLKDAVAEAKYQNVLHRLFTKIMVNTEHLVFMKDLEHLPVQRPGGLEIIAEGFFKYHAPPLTVFFANQLSRAELLRDVSEECGAGGKVEEEISLRIVGLVHCSQRLGQARVELRVMKFTAHITDPADEPVAELWIHGAGSKGLQFFSQDLPVLLLGVVIASHPHHGKIGRQQLALGKVIQRREELARGEVARAAENHHGARPAGRWTS